MSLYLQSQGLSQHEISDILNKKSGLVGISKVSSDMRDLLASDTIEAKLAVDMFCYRVAKYIAAYHVCIQKTDALVFTGGIGENSAFIREEIIKKLDFLQFKIDCKANSNTSSLKDIEQISLPNSKIILKIKACEEITMCKILSEMEAI